MKEITEALSYLLLSSTRTNTHTHTHTHTLIGVCVCVVYDVFVPLCVC